MSILFAIVALAAIGRSESLDPSSQIERCKTFLDLAELDGASILLQKPEYMKSYDICKDLLLSMEKDKPTLNPGVRRLPPINDDVGTSKKRKPANRKLFNNPSHFRQTVVGNIDDVTDCKIEFFKRPHFQEPETRVTLRSSMKMVLLEEKSIRTFGECCWVISNTDYKPKTPAGRVILGGNEELRTSQSWGWNPGSIKSIAKLKKCPSNVGRNRVGFEGQRLRVSGNLSLASSAEWDWPPETVKSIRLLRTC